MCALLTIENRDELQDVEDTTKNLTDAKKADNENKNGCDVGFSLGPGSWGGIQKCWLFDSSVDEEVKYHEGGEGDQGEYQNW